jgi:D-alanyl-D-alanine dipeptidase
MGLSRDWWTFLKTLQRIRYRGGEVGMITRNHYTIADWNPNNSFLFSDMTREVGEGKVAVPLNMVVRRARFFKKFGIGENIPDQPVEDWYIPKERIPEVEHEFQNADFVNIIRGNESSQWAGHTGLIAIADDGTVDFLHSARPAIREQPLMEYVMGDKRCLGIKILRLKPDAQRRMAETLANSPKATQISERALNAKLDARRANAPSGIPYPPVDWRGAMHLQAFRIEPDTAPDGDLQEAIARIDEQVASELGIPEDKRAFGVLDLCDQRLAMIRPDTMFYAASVPKICILLAYFETHPEAIANLPDDVRRELGRMIKVSDNQMAAKYGAIVGIEKVQEILSDKKYKLYDQERQTGMWYGKHYAKGKPRIGDPVHDYSHGATVRQCLRFYLMLEQGRLVSGPACERMREIFAAPELELGERKFVAGLQGRDLSLIRKSGAWKDWHLDTARVAHGDKVYLLAGMTHHPQGAKYLSEMASRVDELLCGSPRPRALRHRRITRKPLAHAIDCPPVSGDATMAALYESPVIESDMPFDEALLSWNIAAPPHVGYRIDARVGHKRDGSWSPYMEIANRGSLLPSDAAPKQTEGVEVDVDYLLCDERHDQLQYRIRAVCGPIPGSSAPPQAKLRIDRVDVTLSDTSEKITTLPRDPRPTQRPPSRWQKRLPVPYRSQLVEDKSIRGRICSPTSVSMVMEYRGANRPTREIAGAIYDETHDIYGNWPRAVQEAYTYGIPGYLTRFSDWRDVESRIADDQPVIVSIQADAGDLSRNPKRSTEGHLLVITGFDESGDVLVNDPASKSKREGQAAHPRADLETVWMQHKHGTAYILLPPNDGLLNGNPNSNTANNDDASQASAVNDEPLVEVADVDPRIMIDLRYATPDNFTEQVLYPTNLRCKLRASVAQRLSRVQDRLESEGLGLKIYDGFRPLSVQRTMWAKVPDPRFVANPANGSRHNRGAAVDVTLVDRAGNELEMPTPYDEFTDAAHRDYTGGSEASLRNRKILSDAMAAEGFTGLPTEWWHFDAPHWREYDMVEED